MNYYKKIILLVLVCFFVALPVLAEDSPKIYTYEPVPEAVRPYQLQYVIALKYELTEGGIDFLIYSLRHMTIPGQIAFAIHIIKPEPENDIFRVILDKFIILNKKTKTLEVIYRRSSLKKKTPENKKSNKKGKQHII